MSAAKLSKKIKSLNNEDYKFILSHLSRLRITSLKKYFNYRDLDKIVNFMRADKKNISKENKFYYIKKNRSCKHQYPTQNFREVKKFITSELLK